MPLVAIGLEALIKKLENVDVDAHIQDTPKANYPHLKKGVSVA